MTEAPLDRRRRDLDALATEPFDVLVIGGGIVGCGAVLDATSRGLKAALVERDDIAVGTSSRSSRLIHGGLRYLEQFHFGLVREALGERARILRLAPHLVHIEPFLFPLYGRPVVTRAFYEAGMTLYDLLGARRDGGFHRHLSVPETLERSPALRRHGLRGALVYHDAVEDDARYTLAVARTARDAGAIMVTRTQAEGFTEREGRLTAVGVVDRESGNAFDVQARAVIDASGPWAADPSSPIASVSHGVLPSRGAHLLVRRDRIPSSVGLTIRVPGKAVFLVPWPGHWLIGTTDAPYEGPIDRPVASADEVGELIGAVNRALDVDLQRDDIVGVYAGVRPLVAEIEGSGSTVTASREHRVVVEPNGLVRISGGKFTTYRLMARDAVDAAIRGLGVMDPSQRPSRTADLRLVGAGDRVELERVSVEIAAAHGLAKNLAGRLVDRHGTEAREIARLEAADGLLAPLGPGITELEVEIAWAARRELAMSLDDVLARRLRLVQQLPDRGASIVPRVAEILGAELGWDAARGAREIAEFNASARREYSMPPAAELTPVQDR
ncbi:MAG TPA: glycerol-3-phosphate dehydrogenase/oxidase [Candidatus Limnocylindrales bacterium]|nr:glycerol-3-phosphate dehydrogenase/oxidase [Candidatus Limnocylindrales bacterium]